MALPVPPINSNNPIPNNPFYYPFQNYLQGDYGPLIVGSGLFVSSDGIISSTGGGGGGGVTALISGNGIFLSANTGIVTVSNTGVLDIVAGNGIDVAKVGGTYTITNIAPGGSPTGTVTQVNTGAGLTGGPITSSGTISLTRTGVAAATYSNPTIIVDEYGRISFAAPGPPIGVFPVQAQLPLVSDGLLPSTLSINPASLYVCGVVRLDDTVTCSSTTLAATASAVKCAYDIAITANTAANAAILCADQAKGCATVAINNSNIALQYASDALVNADAAQTTANNALICADNAQVTATTAETMAITAFTTANTALATANVKIDCASFQAKGDLLVGYGFSQFDRLPIESADNTVLTSCAACPLGMYWSTTGASGGTVTSVTAGTGLTGGTITSSGTIALTTCVGVAGTYQYPRLIINDEGRIADAVEGDTPVLMNCYCTPGQLLIGSGLGSVAALPVPVGLNNQILTTCSACTNGVVWAAPASAPAVSYGNFVLCNDLNGRAGDANFNYPMYFNCAIFCCNLGWSPAANSTICFCCPGLYAVCAGGTLVTSGPGSLRLWAYCNGVELSQSEAFVGFPSNAGYPYTYLMNLFYMCVTAPGTTLQLCSASFGSTGAFWSWSSSGQAAKLMINKIA